VQATDSDSGVDHATCQVGSGPRYLCCFYQVHNWLASALTLYHPGRPGRCPVLPRTAVRPASVEGPEALGSAVSDPSPGRTRQGACWHFERAFVAPGPRLGVGSVPGAAGSPPASYAWGRPAGKRPRAASLRAAASTRLKRTSRPRQGPLAGGLVTVTAPASGSVSHAHSNGASDWTAIAARHGALDGGWALGELQRDAAGPLDFRD